MALHKLIISGFGGQGIMLLGQMLAHAGMNEGKNVTWMPSYGPEMRGGTANCSVIISDSPVSSPVITSATAAAVMNGPSLRKFRDIVEKNGNIIINSGMTDSVSGRTDVSEYRVDCNEAAAGLKNEKAANMVMLGAVADITGAVKISSLEDVIRKYFTGDKSVFVPGSIEALHCWKKR